MEINEMLCSTLVVVVDKMVGNETELFILTGEFGQAKGRIYVFYPYP